MILSWVNSSEIMSQVIPMAFPNPDIIYMIDLGARFIVLNGLGLDKSNPYIDNNLMISLFLF